MLVDITYHVAWCTSDINQAKTGNSSKDDGLVRVTATDRLGFPPQNHRQKLHCPAPTWSSYQKPAFLAAMELQTKRPICDSTTNVTKMPSENSHNRAEKPCWFPSAWLVAIGIREGGHVEGVRQVEKQSPQPRCRKGFSGLESKLMQNMKISYITYYISYIIYHILYIIYYILYVIYYILYIV